LNPRLDRLQTYPFQKLNALLEGARQPPGLKPIPLYIGEPKHATPAFIKDALTASLDGLASYPLTVGTEKLRVSIAQWLTRRYGLKSIDPATQVIPVTGTREALFAIAQAVVDASKRDPLVVCPNPFYQIYEGAALLAGATPAYLNSVPSRNYLFDWEELSADEWRRTQLIYVCSPANPTGHLMSLTEWKELFALSDKYGFVIAADECYSEIHFDEAHPPLGALEAAQKLGRDGFPRLIAFSSLSKRSNVPGMRSGFVAGDAALIKGYLLYRTYHGCVMPLPVQEASVAAWNDEAHVVENRRLYREKFDTAISILRPAMGVDMPEAAFYLWVHTPIPDPEFTRKLYESQAVSVLPGSYLAREAHGVNPGANRVRIALVSSTEECAESAARIRDFVSRLEVTHAR
jgi:N-succinyldiaminopimelate aminotransferase